MGFINWLFIRFYAYRVGIVFGCTKHIIIIYVIANWYTVAISTGSIVYAFRSPSPSPPPEPPPPNAAAAKWCHLITISHYSCVVVVVNSTAAVGLPVTSSTLCVRSVRAPFVFRVITVCKCNRRWKKSFINCTYIIISL